MELLEDLFYPRTIAVVGASRNKEKIGNIIFRNIQSTFKGKVYPVNNKAENVEGVQAYKAVSEIPDKVDMAVISVPREVVLEVMEDLGKAGTKAAIVITSGFKETGEEGAKLEEQLKSVAAKHGIRFLGPNTMGIVTPNFNATFTYVDV
ncbi:MAG: CoA-binding protein, partial [Nitrososphaeria archaeon]